MRIDGHSRTAAPSAVDAHLAHVLVALEVLQLEQGEAARRSFALRCIRVRRVGRCRVEQELDHSTAHICGEAGIGARDIQSTSAALGRLFPPLLSPVRWRPVQPVVLERRVGVPTPREARSGAPVPLIGGVHRRRQTYPRAWRLRIDGVTLLVVCVASTQRQPDQHSSDRRLLPRWRVRPVALEQEIGKAQLSRCGCREEGVASRARRQA
eukprot:4807070-Prymnesium_polylepis.1